MSANIIRIGAQPFALTALPHCSLSGNRIGNWEISDLKKIVQ